jgi:hypothetical protein
MKSPKEIIENLIKTQTTWALRTLGFMCDTDKKVMSSTLERVAFKENGVGYITMAVTPDAFDLITTKKGKVILYVVDEAEYKQARIDLQEHESTNSSENAFMDAVQEMDKVYNSPNQTEQ